MSSLTIFFIIGTIVVILIAYFVIREDKTLKHR